MKFEPMPNRAFLLQYLQADADTGRVLLVRHWPTANCKAKGRPVPREVGKYSRLGYSQVWLPNVNGGGRIVQRSRLMLYLCLGIECDYVDHRDRDTTNDKLDNLRPCSQAENNANGKTRRDNTSGFKGVSWNKQKGDWVAQITKDGVFYGKHFKDKEDAILWVQQKRTELYGEFARH